jgi:hypothetical protein
MSASAATVHIHVTRLDFRLRVDMIVPPLDRLECGPGTVRGTGGAVKALDGADDLKHQRKVALKVLKPELAAVVGAERFLAEFGEVVTRSFWASGFRAVGPFVSTPSSAAGMRP